MDEDQQFWIRAITSIVLAAVVLFPLATIRDMAGFRYLSVASIVALFYTGLVLLVELPSYFNAFWPTAKVELAYFDLNIFSGAAITFFSYTCQIQLMPIFSELVRPNERRINKVVGRAIWIDFLFYFIIAQLGFFSMFNHVNPIVIIRPPIPAGSIDYAMLISICSIALVLSVAFPVNFLPFRN